MSDLPRMKNDDDFVGSLLRAGDDDAPPARSHAAIGAALGLASTAAAGKASAAGAKLGSSIAVKLAVVAVTVGSVIAIKQLVPDRPSRVVAHEVVASAPPPTSPSPPPSPSPSPPPPPPPSPSPRPAHVRVVAPHPAPLEVRSPDPDPDPDPSPSPSPSPSPISISPPPPPATSTLSSENSFLDRAITALRAHNPGESLSLLDAYDTRFPAGILAPEALATRIEATAAIGDPTRARSLATRFLAEHPDSPLARRVRAIVAKLAP